MSSTDQPIRQDSFALNAPLHTRQQLGRILHVINGEHFSGAERVQDLLGKALPDCGYSPGFVCLKEGKFPEQRESTDCPLFIEPMSSKMDLRRIRRISEIAREHDYQLVHAHTPRSLMVARIVSRKIGVPLVYHVHSPVGRDSTRGLQNKLNQWIENWSLKQCHAMICVSGSLQEYMISNGHSQSQLHVVRNGVCSVNGLPQRSTPQGQWTIGTTALFRPRKGTELLIESLAALRQSGQDVKLLAVGPFETEEYENQIKSLADELNVSEHITWTGFQSNVNRYFQEMDLFVLPSLFGEGLPMVVLEAMANGVPVVASDVEGVVEAIRHEVDGLIFQPGSSPDLVSKVTEMVQGKHDWQSMRDNSIQRQRDSFSEFSMAAGVANVYTQLLKGHLAK